MNSALSTSVENDITDKDNALIYVDKICPGHCAIKGWLPGESCSDEGRTHPKLLAISVIVILHFDK